MAYPWLPFGEVKYSLTCTVGKTGQVLTQILNQTLKVMILADTAFGSVEFLHGIRQLKYHAITGVSCDRQLLMY